MAVSVRLDKELEKRLEKLSKLTGRTKSYYIKEALEEKLDDLEEVYLAEQRVEKLGNQDKFAIENLEVDLELAS